MVHFIGEHPLARHPDGSLISRIATAFPNDRTIVTLPGIHATQRLAYTDQIDRDRLAAGQKALTEEEQACLWSQSVDLIVEEDAILIRPDPKEMELAFRADEMLQELLHKRCVKFVHVLNDQVRKAIQRRGEAWRIHPLPKSAEQMEKMITTLRMAIDGGPIYYYNTASGTRWLTCQEFAGLGERDDAHLRQSLLEIRKFSGLRNARMRPEVEFFLAGTGFGAADLAGVDIETISDDRLRNVFDQLRSKFESSVPNELRTDDVRDPSWRNHMYSALIDHRDDVISEEALIGLSSEFFMQVEWLPGARLEEGELIFDSVFDEPARDSDDPQRTTREDTARGLLCNLIQEYADLEYVNIGRVIGSLCKRGPFEGRRDVFVAQVKQRGTEEEILQIIRMQKWGVRERLEQGKDLLRAMVESEEYTEYILDRRLGCRQLGMNLPARVFTRKLTERYSGLRRELEGTPIWSPYFQRDYIGGVATDKLPCRRLTDPVYAGKLAQLLGRAAVPNLIVGRSGPDGHVLFDDGDEVVIEDARGIPADIVVAAHTGTFYNFKSDLTEQAPRYADAVNRRIGFLSDPGAFAGAYIAAFVARFDQIQEEYRKRRRAFDSLFKHRRSDPSGNFAYRWEQVLSRLDRAKSAELAKAVESGLVDFKHAKVDQRDLSAALQDQKEIQVGI